MSMSETQPQSESWIEQLVSVQRGTQPALARLFNIALLVGAGWVISNAVVLLVFLKNRTAGDAFFAFGIMGTGLLGALYLFWRVKQGDYHKSVSLYVTLWYFLILIGAVVFGGVISPAWVLMFWAILCAALFFQRPSVIFAMWGGSVIVWMIIGVFQQMGYQPYGRDLELMNRLFTGFTWTTGLAAVVLLYFMVGYLRSSLGQLERTTNELEDYRRSLERQVLDRTADVQRRAEEFLAVAELNQITSDAGNLQKMLDLVTEHIARRFGFYEVAVLLVDESRQWIVTMSNASSAGLQVARGVRLRIGYEGMIGQAAADRRTHVANDVRQNPHYMPLPELPDTKSEAVLPLIVQDQVIGALDLQSRELNSFGEGDLRVLQVMATNLGMAIENVRRYEQAQRALDRLYRFQEAEVLKLWRKTLERRSEHLQVLYDRIQFTPIASTAQPFGELGDAGMETMTLTRSPEGAYLLAVPLRVHGRVTGRLIFEADHSWTDEEKSLVEAVMNQLGLALENVGLLEETRQRALFEEMAGQIAAHVRSEVEVDAMLQRALVELGQVLGAERSVVSLKLGE